jgi:hypothetical protein
VSDDIDKAARDKAADKASAKYSGNAAKNAVFEDGYKVGWEAGASHALSRPLSEEEIEEAAIAVCWAGFHSPHPSKGGPHKYWERVTESNREYYRRLARGVAEVLQRMRTKG